MSLNFGLRHSGFATLVPLLAASAAGCCGVAGAGGSARARSPLDEAPGLSRAQIAGRLAEEGMSVGDLRTAVLPDGTTVAIVTPQPSDGYSPQVAVVRLENGAPNAATEAVCDPFLWTSNIDSTQFGGLDPARIDAVTWEDWVGNGRQDLVVEFSMSVSASDDYAGSFDSSFRARCAFRPTTDREAGPLTAAVFGWLVEATSKTTYSDTRTEIVERHDVLPVPNEPDQIDYRVTAEVLSCYPGPQGAGLCVPRTESTTRRYAAAGEGFEMAYVPVEEAAYRYPMPDDANSVTGYDDNATGYDDTATGYDGTATGYDDSAAGYDDTATGYDDAATGYDGTATGYDAGEGYEEESAGGE
ncbi:MAG: hypothetical protein GYA57_20935 [Myxococcales bacterium]|nr:hypothetical protein [Myxococcales bacterium]